MLRHNSSDLGFYLLPIFTFNATCVEFSCSPWTYALVSSTYPKRVDMVTLIALPQYRWMAKESGDTDRSLERIDYREEYGGI